MKLINTLFILTIAVLVLACDSKEKEANSSEVKAPKKAIHEAVFFGDLESVRQHIAYGSDLNVPDDYGSSPLHIAITFNKKAIANELIEGGANLEVKSTDGSTPLISAAFFGRTEIVKSLLKNGADIHATNQYQATALTNASMPFSELKPVYDQLSKDLKPFGFKLDYEELQKGREVIAQLLREAESNS